MNRFDFSYETDPTGQIHVVDRNVYDGAPDSGTISSMHGVGNTKEEALADWAEQMYEEEALDFFTMVDLGGVVS